jgi:hypothetical protein
MIFAEKYETLYPKIASEFDTLLASAFQKQPHPGELLILYNNGFYNEEMEYHNKKFGSNYLTYTIGNRGENFSETAHNDFIQKFRVNNFTPYNYDEYLKLYEINKLSNDERKEFLEFETSTIQMEMLCYLKFWESDDIMTKLYQFVRLLNGKRYDWKFRIQKFPNEKNTNGTIGKIIRENIRDEIKSVSPILYDLILNSYSSQIRNSIAHSNYSFLGNQIWLNNFSENPNNHSPKHSISFDEWNIIFNNTLVLHSTYMDLKNKINQKYLEISLNTNDMIEVLIPEVSKNDSTCYLGLRREFSDWSIYINDYAT